VRPSSPGSANRSPTEQAQRLQAGDDHTVFNLVNDPVLGIHGHVTDYNVYGYGDARGGGANSDTAITATGNDSLAYFGELPGEPLAR
jgi:hypothetical protein